MKDAQSLLLAALGSGLLGTLAPAGSYAQSTNNATSATPEGLTEVVVTAQRRTEVLQDVPIAVTSVSAAQLANTGITNIEDLPMAVPSLSVQNGAGYLFTHLRGVGATTAGAGLENPVALYIDGVYYANQSVGFFSFNNISQIDVLKGPQGTLFGRNSTGGLIQITTADPGPDFHMKAEAGASNYSGADGNLYVSGGLAPGLAADVAVQGSRSNGYGTNLYNGQDVYAQPWNVAVRSKWVYTPATWKLTLIGDYSDTKNSYNSLAAAPGSYVVRPFLPAPDLGSNPWNADVNVQPLVQLSDMGLSLKAEDDLGSMVFSNLVAGRKSTLRSFFDDDGTPVPLEGFAIEQPDSQISDEIQLTSKTGGPLQWVAGLYYFYDKGSFDPTRISFAPDPTLNPLYPVGQIIATGTQTSQSYAGFGQITYSLTQQLDLIAGMRYSYEKRTLSDASENGVLLFPGSPVVPLGPPIPTQSQSFNQPTYRLALDYKITPDFMVYGSYNTGFKSGGYNASNPTDPPFSPENLYAYEVGEKAEMLDHKLRVNSSAFYYDYKNIQIQKPEAFALGIINGAKATIYGLDTEITAIPIKALELSAGLSLLHTKFNDFPDAPISTPGGGVPTTIGSATGNELPYSPKAVVNVSATYFILPTLSVNATYYHSAQFYFEPDNVATQSAFDKVNASVLWTTTDQRYWVRLYGNNIGNTAVYNSFITTPAGAQLPTLAPPRIYGIKLGINY